MGETRVDLLHLLEDLRDAYTGSLEETILTEIVANSLDSTAHGIRLNTDTAKRTLTITDDGSGMKRPELRRYHDIAASTKVRGQGIGFAGVGIKLALLTCDSVYTESRRGKIHVATVWHLASKHRAPWKWVPPEGLVADRGTAIRLELTNALSPLQDPGFVEATLRRHYPPLFDPFFEPLLSSHYPHGVQVAINERSLEAAASEAGERASLAIRIGRKRKPSAIGYLVRDVLPLPEDQRGVAVSTYGKVIRRGWDWIGIHPATPESIGGAIEFPELADCLTLNKADFIRSGPRGMVYLACRRAIQNAVSQQLAEWGDAREAVERTRRKIARPVERDLERVLIDLADDFPLLGTIVEQRSGGQRRLPIGGRASLESGRELVAAAMEASAAHESNVVGNGSLDAEPTATVVQEAAPAERERTADGMIPGAAGFKRPAHYGLRIEFDTRPGDAEISRLVESTVWVNDAHPAFRRAALSRSEGYHLALAVAMALAPLAAEPAQQHRFVTTFLGHWGLSLENGGRGKRGR
ncbi:MAG: hypothetical protein E6K80_11305 [Candidatus Eisenbacteria bacterium]|uniref:ATP-binding protein n=1 Tax=Eiseniibacteriota bacterium TaxID=2212470 RepID=A0A538U0V5_UNCEI|nr:MAG: hypothetical protein E6K80_11305 [Candidatus Eisenbacteria bacterium]